MKKKSNISIKAKLLGIIIPVVIAIILILVFTAYHVSSGIIESYSQNLLESSVNSQASKIEAWLEENLASMQMAKTMIEKLHPDETQLQTILDASCGYSENYPDGLFLADANGSFLKGTDSKKQEPNPKESMWYQEGMTRVNMAVGSAHQNPDGTNVVSASGLLNDGLDTVRVIAADMTLDRISVIVNSFIEMHDAEAFLVDKDSSVILASRDSDLISKTLGADGQSAFYKDVEKKVSGKSYDFCTLDGNMTVFKEVNGTNWLLVSYVPTRVVLADLVGLRNLMIIFSIISILVLCVLIERVTHVVIRPVKEMTRVITSMASGDFTVSMKVKGNDEIAVMGRSVEHFIASMKEMIRQMGHVSDRLEKQAGSSKNVSGEMNSAANIQSQSMTELNATVDQLSVSVNEIAQNATQLAGVVADTKEDSDKVEDKMRTTVEVSEKGKADMESVGNALHNIEISIHNLEEAVDKALSNNMTRDTLNRAIARGVGGDEDANMETIIYEGYGPGGTAVMVECLSDNRNRTVAEVRHAFTKTGGNLGTDGSVAYLFSKKGVISFEKGDEDVIMEAALEAGAEDVVTYDDGAIDVYTAWEEMGAVRDALEAAGLKADNAEVSMIPSTKADMDAETAPKLLRLIDMLEDCDDVQEVYHNGEISDEVAATL